jgi:hypothetical protein
MTSSNFSAEFAALGVLPIPAALPAERLSWLWSHVQPETADGAVTTRSGTYGARSLLVARPQLRHVFAELDLDGIAARALGVPAFSIDAQFFDKNSGANWTVPAHQDIVVPVPSNASPACVRNIRTRHGTTYGEPPVQVLEELVAVRVHFDDSDVNSGGLSIAPGSHARGRLSDGELRQFPSETFRPYDCRAGDVLVMKPLVVHRSPRAASPVRRRVLHVLYAPVDGWHGTLSRHAA